MQHSIEFAVTTSCSSSDIESDHCLLRLKDRRFSTLPKCSPGAEPNTSFATQIFCYLIPNDEVLVPSFLNNSSTDRSDYMLLGKSSGFIEIIVDYKYKIKNGLPLEPDFVLDCYPGEILGDRRPDYLIVGMEYMDGLLYCCMGSGRIYVYPLNLPPNYVQEVNLYSFARCRELLINQTYCPTNDLNGNTGDMSHNKDSGNTPGDSGTKSTTKTGKCDFDHWHSVQECTVNGEESDLPDTYTPSQYQHHRYRYHHHHHHYNKKPKEDESFYRIIAYRGKSKLRHLCYYLPFANKPSSTLSPAAVDIFQNYKSKGAKIFRPCMALNIDHTISEFHINPFDSLSFLLTAPCTPIMMRKITLDSSYLKFFQTLMKIKKIAQKLSPTDDIQWKELAVEKGYGSLLDWLIYEAAYEHNRTCLLSWKKIIEMKGIAILGSTIVWRQSSAHPTDDVAKIVTDNAVTRDGTSMFFSREYNITGTSISRSRLLQRRRRRIFDTPVSSNYRVEAFLKRVARNTFTTNFKVFRIPSQQHSDRCFGPGGHTSDRVVEDPLHMIYSGISEAETTRHLSGGGISDVQRSGRLLSPGSVIVRSISGEEMNEDPNQIPAADSIDDASRNMLETSTHISSESEQNSDASSAFESSSDDNENDGEDLDDSNVFYHGLNRNPNLHDDNGDDGNLSGNRATTFLPAKYEQMCIFSIDHFLSLQSFMPRVKDEPVFRIDSFPMVSEFIRQGFLSQEDITISEVVSRFNSFKKLYVLTASLCLILDVNGVLIIDSKNVQDFENLIKNDATVLKVASAKLGLITDSILILERFDKCEDCLSFDIEFTLIVACLPRCIKAFKGVFKAHSKIGSMELLDTAMLNREDRYVDKIQLVNCGYSQNPRKRRQESISGINVSKKSKRGGG